MKKLLMTAAILAFAGATAAQAEMSQAQMDEMARQHPVPGSTDYLTPAKPIAPAESAAPQAHHVVHHHHHHAAPAAH